MKATSFPNRCYPGTTVMPGKYAPPTSPLKLTLEQGQQWAKLQTLITARNNESSAPKFTIR